MSTTMPRSALRHRPITQDIPEFVLLSPRASTQVPGPPRLARKRVRNQSPLMLIGGSMVLTFLLLWTIGNLWSWGSTMADELHYGYPRTTQADRTVGHEIGHTISHFTAQNIGGQVYVLEIPGGNPAGSHLLIGPRLIGPGADLAPVLLVFQGDPRHPNLMIEIDGIAEHFHNTGKTYEPGA